MLWRVDAEAARSLAGIQVGDAERLSARAATGEVLWEAAVEGDDERGTNVGLLLGAFVAQPDL